MVGCEVQVPNLYSSYRGDLIYSNVYKCHSQSRVTVHENNVLQVYVVSCASYPMDIAV